MSTDVTPLESEPQRPATEQIADHIEQVAARVERLADGIEAATERFLERWQGAEGTARDLQSDFRRPLAKVTRAVEGLAVQARKSATRLKDGPRSRFAFWR